MAAESVSEALADVLGVFEDHGTGEPLSTSEVAEGLECTRRTTYNRLERLAEEDLVRTKKVGAKARVWWRPSAGPGESAATGADDGMPVQWGGERYRRLVESAPVPIGVFTHEGIVYANDATLEFLEAEDRDAVLGRSPLAFVDATDSRAVLDRIETALEERVTPDPIEGRFLTVEGERRIAIAGAVPVTYDGQAAAQYVLEDVTEYRRAREIIEEQQEFFERAVDVLPDIFYVVDGDGQVVVWNDALTERTGYTDEEVATMRSFDFVPEDQWRATFEEVRNLEDREESTIEADLLTAEDERIPHEFRHVRLHDEVTGEAYWVGIGRDVTERRRRQRELEATNERLSAVIESSPAAIISIDREGQVTQWNPAAERIFGWSEEEVLGEPLPFVPEDRTEEYEELKERLLDGEAVTDFETRRRRKDGNLIDVRLSAGPLRNADGEVIGVTAAIADVTERKRSQRRLEREKARFERLVSNLPGMVYRCRNERGWPMEFVEGECEALTGYPASALEDDEVVWGEEILHPDDREEMWEVVQTALDSRDPFEVTYRIVDADGNLKWMWERGRGIYEDGDLVALEGFVTDVTDRKESKQRLQRERDRFETLVSNLPGMVYRCDTDQGWPMEFVSEACTDLTGYAPERIESDEILWGDDVIHPDDREMVREEVQAAVQRDEQFKITYRIRRADGRERWVWEQGRCVETGDDREILEGYITDVTERKQQERRLKRQREQLATLNDLNEVVQRTTHAMVAADSRSEVERSVCEQLADSNQYLGAWIGDWRGADADSFRVRASEGCSDGATIADDPAGTALRTGEPQVRRGVDEVGCVPPAEAGEEPTAAAAIPVTHAGLTYGVLTVCADRPEAFDDPELATVARLGEVVGHAIAAAERKEALMGDRATELVFQSDEPIVPYLAVEGTDVSLDRTIPLEDGTVVYCTASVADPASFASTLETRSRVESVNRIDGAVGDPRFEVRVTGSTVSSVIAAAGGRIRSVDSSDDGTRIVAEVAPRTDVRRVVEAVQESYSALELASRETVEREGRRDRLARSDDWELTDRQHRVLEAAFRAGYFDRPRRSTGEDVAQSLDVSASTFHEHLRIGERKILEELFGER